jgi:N-acyl-D-amino-acid deacylase
MTFDTIIRGGLVVDGTGAAARRADIGIEGGVIKAVGEISAEARESIDASGMVVTPGFIDLHTHLDAQVGWDPLLRPLTYHGVTTALMGNCGVTFAPCRPNDRALLAEMMESVEDIPRAAILEGLPWSWESYGEYLDAVEKLNPAINLAGLVGHSAVRFYVMGAKAIDTHPDPRELEAIARVVGESVRDGAFGCSINRLRGHAMPDGRDIPGTDARADELLAIARAVGAEGGLVQTIPSFPELAEEFKLMIAMGKETGRLLWSAPVAWTSEAVAWVTRWMNRMRDAGIHVTGLSSPRSGGLISGIAAEVFIHQRPRRSSWKALKAMSFTKRLAALNDPAFRARLIEHAESIPGLEEWALATFPLGEGPEPDWMPAPEHSVHARAQALGISPVAVWIDAMRASEGKALFFIRQHNRNFPVMRELLQCDWVVPGLGDAGAHCSISMDSGFPTLMLAQWVRKEPLFTLEQAVHRLSGRAAETLGLLDRGVLAPGKRADVNVIDLDRLAECQPEMLYDFPGGAAHLSQRARGYRATLCNGVTIVRDDELTGARPGQVLRSN